ncbi:hypothetical protein AMECASPLE_034345 [Ameca splendens]|uniref:Uncharacterized protein n=1 Tax=Ameca splendens TaxID=208324 RepID=A0ABV0XVZ4_9TELE
MTPVCLSFNLLDFGVNFDSLSDSSEFPLWRLKRRCTVCTPKRDCSESETGQKDSVIWINGHFLNLRRLVPFFPSLLRFNDSTNLSFAESPVCSVRGCLTTTSFLSKIIFF